MKGMLDPEYEERVTGHAEVRQTFKAVSYTHLDVYKRQSQHRGNTKEFWSYCRTESKTGCSAEDP